MAAPRANRVAAPRANRVLKLFSVLLATTLVAVACNPEQPPAHGNPCRVGIIGDSLTEGIAPYFQGHLSQVGCTLVFIDGLKNRDTATGAQVLAAKDLTKVDIVVVALGTNDWHKPTRFKAAMEQVMKSAKGKRVVWPDLTGKLQNKHAINDDLWQSTFDYTTLWVLAWSKVIDSNPQFLAKDGIHYNADGYRSRSQTIAKFIANGHQPA